MGNFRLKVFCGQQVREENLPPMSKIVETMVWYFQKMKITEWNKGNQKKQSFNSNASTNAHFGGKNFQIGFVLSLLCIGFQIFFLLCVTLRGLGASWRFLPLTGSLEVLWLLFQVISRKGGEGRFEWQGEAELWDSWSCWCWRYWWKEVADGRNTEHPNSANLTEIFLKPSCLFEIFF